MQNPNPPFRSQLSKSAVKRLGKKSVRECCIYQKKKGSLCKLKVMTILIAMIVLLAFQTLFINIGCWFDRQYINPLLKEPRLQTSIHLFTFISIILHTIPAVFYLTPLLSILWVLFIAFNGSQSTLITISLVILFFTSLDLTKCKIRRVFKRL